MPFCPNCGPSQDPSDNFCGTCGRGLSVGVAGAAAFPGAGLAPRTLPYAISLNRVLMMSVLSHGLYLFYWYYVTWKQYRDHTRPEVFPVWHALTLLVPIYGLFRTHAHMRSFKELMVEAGLATTISAGWAVVLVMVSKTLSGVSFYAAGGFGDIGGMTQNTAIAIGIIDFCSIIAITALLRHVQANLNRYWSNLENVQLVNAKVGAGEVIFGLIGGLSWFDTLANVLSAADRAGP